MDDLIHGLLDTLSDEPRSEVPKVIADAWEDAGKLRPEWWRISLPPIVSSMRYEQWYGYGNGYGCGDGNGYGYGYGNGNGNGYGNGNGNGNGNGYGNGNGNGQLTPKGSKMPKIGKNQLIVLSDGWVIVGFVAGPGDQPYSWDVHNASVICSTGGTPWDELADGKGRSGAVFRRWGEVQIGPSPIMSREWKGDLP